MPLFRRIAWHDLAVNALEFLTYAFVALMFFGLILAMRYPEVLYIR